MTRTFIQTKEFTNNWNNLGYNDEDLRRLELELINNIKKYPVIKGTGGLRKMRFSLGNRGKSSGVRVCFVDFVVKETVYLITVYPKSEKDNLTKDEKNEIKKMITLLEKNLD